MLGTQILAQADAAGNLRFLASDAMGSTRLLTNAAGAITDRFDFDAYGNALDFDPATAATKILFAGQIYDSGSGQYDGAGRGSTTRRRASSPAAEIRSREAPIIRSPSTHMATPTATRRTSPIPADTDSSGPLSGSTCTPTWASTFSQRSRHRQASATRQSAGSSKRWRRSQAVPFVALPEIGPVFAFLNALGVDPLFTATFNLLRRPDFERHAQ